MKRRSPLVCPSASSLSLFSHLIECVSDVEGPACFAKDNNAPPTKVYTSGFNCFSCMIHKYEAVKHVHARAGRPNHLPHAQSITPHLKTSRAKKLRFLPLIWWPYLRRQEPGGGRRRKSFEARISAMEWKNPTAMLAAPGSVVELPGQLEDDASGKGYGRKLCVRKMER